MVDGNFFCLIFVTVCRHCDRFDKGIPVVFSLFLGAWYRKYIRAIRVLERIAYFRPCVVGEKQSIAGRFILVIQHAC